MIIFTIGRFVTMNLSLKNVNTNIFKILKKKDEEKEISILNF